MDAERQRSGYRKEVERRLFDGASIDQHIGLINVVRSPRVGDRIDVDLPAPDGTPRPDSPTRLSRLNDVLTRFSRLSG